MSVKCKVCQEETDSTGENFFIKFYAGERG